MSNNSDGFLILGNDPALDLVNTMPVLAEGPVDLLKDYAGFTRWVCAVGLASSAECAGWARRWGDTREGARALERMKELREELRRTLLAVRSGDVVREKSVEGLNAVLEGAPVHQQVHWDAAVRRFARKRSHGEQGAEAPVVLVAEAIAGLLSERDLEMVRKCENPKCVLWFYDSSKNHTRRWCSMEFCGNRAKAAAHYRRHVKG